MSDELPTIEQLIATPFFVPEGPETTIANLRAKLASTTEELARVKEEATENHRMWEHWQNKAVEAQGDLSRESQVAQAYHNAFDEAIRQRDAALAERDALIIAAREAEVALAWALNNLDSDSPIVFPGDSKFCHAALAALRAVLPPIC